MNKPTVTGLTKLSEKLHESSEIFNKLPLAGKNLTHVDLGTSLEASHLFDKFSGIKSSALEFIAKIKSSAFIPGPIKEESTTWWGKLRDLGDSYLKMQTVHLGKTTLGRVTLDRIWVNTLEKLVGDVDSELKSQESLLEAKMGMGEEDIQSKQEKRESAQVIGKEPSEQLEPTRSRAVEDFVDKIKSLHTSKSALSSLTKISLVRSPVISPLSSSRLPYGKALSDHPIVSSIRGIGAIVALESLSHTIIVEDAPLVGIPILIPLKDGRKLPIKILEEQGISGDKHGKKIFLRELILDTAKKGPSLTGHHLEVVGRNLSKISTSDGRELSGKIFFLVLPAQLKNVSEWTNWMFPWNWHMSTK